MSGSRESFRENCHPENESWKAPSNNTGTYTSNVQKYLRETLNPRKYKEHTIDYWLNEIFCLPREKYESLRTKVNFSKQVSINGLLNEIELEDEELNLWNKELIILADESLDKCYYDIFEDYLFDDKGIQISSKRQVSIKYFLKLLSWFEKERLQTIADWAGDDLMHDTYSNFEIYCERNWKKCSNFVCYRTYLRLLEGFQQEEKEENKIYSL